MNYINLQMKYLKHKNIFFSIGGNFMNDILYLVIPCYNEEEVLHETAKRLLL